MEDGQLEMLIDVCDEMVEEEENSVVVVVVMVVWMYRGMECTRRSGIWMRQQRRPLAQQRGESVKWEGLNSNSR